MSVKSCFGGPNCPKGVKSGRPIEQKLDYTRCFETNPGSRVATPLFANSELRNRLLDVFCSLWDHF